MRTFETDILLATYNGGEFLSELLDSLDRQTDQDWRLVVRDDGSTDDTIAILTRWAGDKGARFELLTDGKSNLGATENFGALLEASQSRYFLPCDQDDVWLPHKVAHLKAAIKKEEGRVGPETPIIVHTDLIVTDASLRPVAQSLWEYQRIRMLPSEEPWKLITWQNVVTGCAMIGNAALLRVAMPLPEDAMVHDWWLGLIATLTGCVVRDTQPSIMYRQHGENSLGAQKASPWRLIRFGVSAPLKALTDLTEFLDGTRKQSAAALARLQPDLDTDKAEFLRAYANLGNAGILKRKTFAFRHGLYYHGAVRNAAFYAVM